MCCGSSPKACVLRAYGRNAAQLIHLSAAICFRLMAFSLNQTLSTGPSSGVGSRSIYGCPNARQSRLALSLHYKQDNPKGGKFQLSPCPQSGSAVFVFVRGASIGSSPLNPRAFLNEPRRPRPGRGCSHRAAQGDNGIPHVLPLTGTALSACLSRAWWNAQDRSVRHHVASAPTFAPRPSYRTVFRSGSAKRADVIHHDQTHAFQQRRNGGLPFQWWRGRA